MGKMMNMFIEMMNMFIVEQGDSQTVAELKADFKRIYIDIFGEDTYKKAAEEAKFIKSYRRNRVAKKRSGAALEDI